MSHTARAATGAGLSVAQQWQIVRAQSLRLLKDFDEGKHPRVPAGSPDGGQFTSGGGGGTSDAKPDEGALDPKVVEVGGDEWNRAAARRLEREYQAAKPKIDKLTDDAVGETTEVTSDEEEEPPYVPEEWDGLSGAAQEQAKEEYFTKSKPSYIESEQQYWHESGNALDDAKVIVASDYSPSDEWAAEAVADVREEFKEEGKSIPFTDEQILEAISLNYEAGYEGAGDLDVEFDDSALQEPSNLPPKEQGTLPGIEPMKPEAQLTKAMRDRLTKAISVAFDKAAEDKADSLEPPDYLADGVDDLMEESWNSMGDDDKFQWVKHNTDIIENESTEGSGPSSSYTTVDALPDKFDPLNETSGRDYKRTQALARYLSVERAKEVLTERDIKFLPDLIPRIDGKLWGAWKGSSTSQDGSLLQIAAADELGGRLNAKTSKDLDRDALIKYANSEFGAAGGYAGIKAYVRAKWEVSQYLLDRAGIKELELFRGIRLDTELYQKLFAPLRKHLAEATDILPGRGPVEAPSGYKHMSTLHVARNGAASTSVSAAVANGWGHDQNRVVLRALIPRTAALSLPVFGINVHSEKEVVVAGTAWKGWDAWAGRAPSFRDVPLKVAA